jgi:exodeoxyribonuclease VII small subunit
MNDKITYSMAMVRLEEIMGRIQGGNIDIETLTEELAEAQQLISFCRNRIYKLDEDIKALIDGAE